MKATFFSKTLLVGYIFVLLALLIPWLSVQAEAINIIDQNQLRDAIQDTQDNPVEFVPNIDIPGTTDANSFNRGVRASAQQGADNATTVSLLGKYIQSIYRFFVGVAAIIATFMIALGGFMWLVSGGGDNIKKAKEFIIGAISGLILILGSYVFLVVLNPNLTRLDLAVPNVSSLALSGLGSDFCKDQIGDESSFVSISCLEAGTCDDYSGVEATFDGVELTSVHPGLVDPLMRAVKTLTTGQGLDGRTYAVIIKSVRRTYDNQAFLRECYNQRENCPADCNGCPKAAVADCNAPHIRGVAIDVCINRTYGEVIDVPHLCLYMKPQRSISQLKTYFSEQGKSSDYGQAVDDLYKAMNDEGFRNQDDEWWHYDKLSLPSPIPASSDNISPYSRPQI